MCRNNSPERPTRAGRARIPDRPDAAACQRRRSDFPGKSVSRNGANQVGRRSGDGLRCGARQAARTLLRRAPLVRHLPLSLNGYGALSVGTTSGDIPVDLTVNAVKSSFSSTGGHLAFISAGNGEYWNACSGSGTLSVARGDGTHLVQVADFVVDFVFGGDTLYFYAGGVSLMSFFRFRESDPAPVLLSQAPSPAWTRQSQSFPGYSMAPSPGGDAVAYCEPAADYVQPRCFLLPAGADAAAAILIEGAAQLAWTPDGEWLLAGRIALSRAGKLRRDFGETCAMPSPSPDGNAVMFGTGKQYACDGPVAATRSAARP